MKIVTVLGLLVGLGSSVAVGQQAGSSAPSSPADAAPALAKVVDVGADMVAPVLLPSNWTKMEPGACKKEIDGTVELSLMVDRDGVPSQVTPSNAQGTPLEEVAMRIVGADRFKPATQNGEPVLAMRLVKVTFKGCFIKKKNDAGGWETKFQLTEQPDQKFGAFPPLGKTGQNGIAGSTGSGDSPEVYRAGGEVSAPVVLNHVEAKYTAYAQSKGIHGVCAVILTVDANGRPQNPRVIGSLEPGLDLKAIEAVNKYQFKPAMKKGLPVPVIILVEVNFSLN